MPKTVVTWIWEEAFQKFGFNDGNDSQTWRVEGALEDAGYASDEVSGVHNTYICGLRRETGEVWNDGACDATSDTARLRASLPPEVVALLDRVFPDDLVLEAE